MGRARRVQTIDKGARYGAKSLKKNKDVKY